MSTAEISRSFSENQSPQRLFAVVPAAGAGRRLGGDKLLLPLGGQTVIARLLSALDRPELFARAVVVRNHDVALADEVRRCGGWVIHRTPDPPDMRASVEAAITAIRKSFQPLPNDGWLLTPADHPVLNANLVGELTTCWQTCDADVLLPTWQKRRGHPAILRWRLADRLVEIPENQGINWLFKQPDIAIQEVAVSTPDVLTDLDTPADYAVLQKKNESE